MAVIYPNMTKHVYGGKELVLAPETNQSILIKNISIQGTATTGALEVWVDQKSVAYYMHTYIYETQLAYGGNDVSTPTLMQALTQRGYDARIPVAEGQRFSIKTEDVSVGLIVDYSVYDAGDITPDMPNGTNWSEWIIVSWGGRDGDMTVPGWYTFNKCLNPSPYPNFPYESDVPSGVQVDVLGILFRTFQRNTYVGSVDTYGASKYLRFTRGTKVLFDTDLQGFLVVGSGASPGSVNVRYFSGPSQIGFYRNFMRDPLFLLDEPLSLVAGEDLTVELYVDGDSGCVVPDGDAEIGLILRYRRA